jgi:hypothetical protein
MSRSGYVDDCDNWSLIRWRGAVKSSIRGKRGQDFFKALISALDTMTEKRLIKNSLESDVGFCTLGVLGKSRKIDMSDIDPEDSQTVACKFNIAEALAREVLWMNDEACYFIESTEQRWNRMRAWAEKQINVVR